MLNHLLKFFQKRFGLIFLTIILSVISYGILKPNFFLLGWDNFSSYLNLKSSLFNTLFASWREHRGLGVPSDAEINDIFRQLFSLFVSLFVKKELIDQLYVTLMLWGGTLGMYFLGRYVSRLLKKSEAEREIYGAVASFFYLFNLSTLAVFYFPMIMYVTRFFMLPTSTYIMLHIIYEPKISRTKYLLYLALLFIGFGSYMVPTIFIVTMVAFGLMLPIFQYKKRVIGGLSFMLLLSSYWILPFANYTIQKGNIVPQAPLFIDINEAMLNKPASYYNFSRQAKLRPSFFETQFTNKALDQPQNLHELAGNDEKGVTVIILWLFPVLYLLGIAYVYAYKRDRVLVWFATITLLFLIISMKEYSIFGPIYGFISDHVPFANTVFRFGDTKFHAMVAFGGSILVASLIVELYGVIVRTKINRLIKPIVLLMTVSILTIPQLFVFKSYFTGNFIGFFMYNKIPSAYFEIADTINNDPDPIRVMHLPIDTRGYWKPYTWGYFGSSFLHFLLSKPIFDRTFEPGSAENTQVHQQIMDMFHMVSSVSSDDVLEDRATKLYTLLKNLSVKYVIDDGTISTNVVARNVTYWGMINPFDSHRLLKLLEKNGNIKLIKQYSVIPKDYAYEYAKLYPYNSKIADDASLPRSIYLYEVVGVAPRAQLLSEVDKVHSAHASLLSPAIKNLVKPHYIQSKAYDLESLILPFAMDPQNTQIDGDNLRMTLPINHVSGTYTFESNDTTKSNNHLVKVYAKKTNTTLRVYFQYPVYPEFSGSTLEKPNFSTTLDLPLRGNDPPFVRIADSIFPLDTIQKDTKLLGSILSKATTISVSLLYPQDKYDVGASLVQKEPNPQCLGDAIGETTSHITGDGGILTIAGQNVSNCLTTDVTLNTLNKSNSRSSGFAQLEFDAEGRIEALAQKKSIDSKKPVLYDFLGTKDNPLAMHVCIKPIGTNVCINRSNLFLLTNSKQHYTVPISGEFTNIDTLQVTFTIRNSQRQKYETHTTNISFKTFAVDSEKIITLNEPKEQIQKYALKPNNSLNVIVPFVKSDFTQNIDFTKDAVLIGRDPSCDQSGKFQSVKNHEQGLMLYSLGCKNFINRNIPFSADNFYLWSATYKLLSGNRPSLIIMDKINTQLYKRFNPLEVNANNYFVNALQKPESLFTSLQSISKRISDAPFYTVSGYIEPNPELQNNGNKEFIIEHFSQNEGAALLSHLSLVQLPNQWLTSKLVPNNYQSLKFSSQAKIISYKEILPSLKQITINTKNNGNYLLLFNEQHDKQWIVLGARSLLHATCDGYANCYRINLFKGSSSFYLFYIPEILSFIGISMSLVTSIVGYRIFSTRNNHYN